ncbi:MAG: hypothetical protein CM15mP126_1450 [Gammaproteobacteria bacterium]|nr:MAG: hypothetical protein CM15mP126_1450 [Gammaproteobacteria bacterium]
MYGTPFEIFGVVHVLTIAIVILISALLPKFYKNKSDSQKLTMARIIIAVMHFILFLPHTKIISVRESL